MDSQKRRIVMMTLAAWLLMASMAVAQGVTTKKSAVVLYGATTNCSQPATIDWSKVRKATPEWKKIKSQGVRKGSGRYDLLISDMSDRIKKAVASVADAEGRDCVVRKGDIKKSNGLQVADLTSQVVSELGN